MIYSHKRVLMALEDLQKLNNIISTFLRGSFGWLNSKSSSMNLWTVKIDKSIKVILIL